MSARLLREVGECLDEQSSNAPEEDDREAATEKVKARLGCVFDAHCRRHAAQCDALEETNELHGSKSVVVRLSSQVGQVQQEHRARHEISGESRPRHAASLFHTSNDEACWHVRPEDVVRAAEEKGGANDEDDLPLASFLPVLRDEEGEKDCEPSERDVVENVVDQLQRLRR